MTVFANSTNSTVGRQLSGSRPSFMITDILAAKVSGDSERIQVPVNDFDSDEDFADEADGNSSVCSNGKYKEKFIYFSLLSLVKISCFVLFLYHSNCVLFFQFSNFNVHFVV